MNTNIRIVKLISKWFISLSLATAVSVAHAAIVYLGGTADYEDTSSLAVALPDQAIIVPNNSSYGFVCGSFGGNPCTDTAALFTTWADNTYGDVILTGSIASFDVVANVIENYTFAFEGMDASTGTVTITADDVETCRSDLTCSDWIPGEPNYYEIDEVPIPAAAWLFGSALLGLGLVKRRKA